MIFALYFPACSIDKILQVDDACDILDELIEAKNCYRILGLKLELPLYEVDAIRSTHTSPTDHLLDVITAFLKNHDRPTWRIILNALRTPSVNLPHLARKLMMSKFPKPASAPDFLAEATISTGNTFITIVTVINNCYYTAVANIPISTPAQPSHETSNSGKW